MTSLLSCRDVRISAPDGSIVHDKLNIELSAGARLAVMGPSGSGKTTLLRAILNDLPPGFRRTGRVLLGGDEQRPGNSSSRRRTAETVAMLPQDAGASLTPTMRVGTLLKEAAVSRSPTSRAVIEQLLDAVQLPHDAAFLRRRPWQLSGGQQRRLALARALARQRPLLILDEPTAGLDPVTRAHILKLLEKLSGELRSALLLVTHDRAAADTLQCDLQTLSGCEPDRASIISAPRKRPAADPSLVLRRATITDGSGATVSSNTTIELYPGRIAALQGASGVGKTTIARTLAGFAVLHEGSLLFRGSPLPSDPRRRTRAQRRAIQLVAQTAGDAFNPYRTIRQSLLDAQPTIDPLPLLEELRLTVALVDRLPRQLSGGQQQRLALLRALSLQPDVLILDEPTSALDPETSYHVSAAVRKAADGGAAVLFITHEAVLDRDFVDESFVLIDGHLQRRF